MTLSRNAFTYTGKGSNGCSVFRQMERDSKEAVQESLLSLDGHADFVVSLSYGLCSQANIYVEHTPSVKSKYHTELFQNKNKDKLNDEQLDFLAINCIIEKNE